MGSVERAADDDTLVFYWALVDKVYDVLVEVGFAPIVGLNPVPACLVFGHKTSFFFKKNAADARTTAADALNHALKFPGAS